MSLLMKALDKAAKDREEGGAEPAPAARAGDAIAPGAGAAKPELRSNRWRRSKPGRRRQHRVNPPSRRTRRPALSRPLHHVNRSRLPP